MNILNELYQWFSAFWISRPLSKTIIDAPPMIHTSVTFAVVES